MGFKKNWDTSDIANQIRHLYFECSNACNDGFVAWGCKQDLYVIKDLIDETLKKCPSFGDLESSWLKEQEQKRIIKILKE